MPNINTGTPLVSRRSGTCDASLDPCVFFDTSSSSAPGANYSHVFDVTEPLQIMAFDLPDGDKVTLQQVFGPNDGDYFESVKVGSAVVQLNKCNNRVLVPFKGRFRLLYEVGTPGTAVVVCEPSDCCFADFFPKDVNMSCCPETAAEIAAKLAFHSCAGIAITPGATLATCADLAALPAAPVQRLYNNAAGVQHANGACIPSCAEMTAAGLATQAAAQAATIAAASVLLTDAFGVTIGHLFP